MIRSTLVPWRLTLITFSRSCIVSLDHAATHAFYTLSLHDALPILVGYLITRLEQLRWGPVAIIATSSLLRGSYHRSEEHTSELQSRGHLVCRLLLEKKEIAIADK